MWGSRVAFGGVSDGGRRARIAAALRAAKGANPTAETIRDARRFEKVKGSDFRGSGLEKDGGCEGGGGAESSSGEEASPSFFGWSFGRRTPQFEQKISSGGFSVPQVMQAVGFMLLAS